MYKCPMTQWIPTCKEVGGPSSVDLEYCLNQDTGCEAFKRGYCKFDLEHVLQNIAGNFSPENCQVSMVTNSYVLSL